MPNTIRDNVKDAIAASLINGGWHSSLEQAYLNDGELIASIADNVFDTLGVDELTQDTPAESYRFKVTE